MRCTEHTRRQAGSSFRGPIYYWHAMCNSPAMKPDMKDLFMELQELDNEPLERGASTLKPSQYFYFGTDPVHLLYSTNCPAGMKQKIEWILSKYIPGYKDAFYK